MARDLQHTAKEVLSRVVHEAGKTVSHHNPTRSGG